MFNRRLRGNGRSIADRHRESGQALIELALTMPLLFIMLLGAAEFGRLAYMAIEISEAAKATAQYGSQNATTANDTTGNPNGLTLVARKNAPYVYANCTNFTVTVPSPAQCFCMSGGSPTSSTPTSAACSAACTGGYPVQVLTVTTSATCSPVFHPPGFSGAGITLRGSAVQEVLN
jgi:Flp pilus assembly protein TadG